MYIETHDKDLLDLCLVLRENENFKNIFKIEAILNSLIYSKKKKLLTMTSVDLPLKSKLQLKFWIFKIIVNFTTILFLYNKYLIKISI